MSFAFTYWLLLTILGRRAISVNQCKICIIHINLDGINLTSTLDT